MTWASRRQTIILGVLAIIAIAILVPLLKPVVAPPATCFDNKKNQGELGVDCGLPCQKVCPFEADKVAVLWVRSFEVAPGVYSAVAYLSNPNAYFEAKNVPYTMKVYDNQNILLAEHSGKINIPAKSTLPVFVGGINVGKLKVQQASFELKGELDWQRTDKGTPKINVSSPIVTTEGTPKVTVTIKNNTDGLLKNMRVVAIVFDGEGNAIAASNTVIDKLAKNESTDVSFTWLLPFSSSVSRVEVYPDTTN
ncbi:MAG: FxLYD domain-containing protein [bacterium]|nr:FxLYD domain-containing protein [bacterium]